MSYDLSEQPTAKRAPLFKSAAFSALRLAHRALAPGAIDGKVSIYFHALARQHWPQFRGAVEHFLARGYRSVSPAEFVAADAAERCLFISFDDNFKDWHGALGLFASLGVRATFYTNTGPFRDVASDTEIARFRRRLALTEPRETLTRGELAELAAAGHTIGCHSHSHYVLSRLPRTMWDDEIGRSKAMLEEIVGQPVTDFAWPYGMRRHFSLGLRDYCAGIGFKTITNAISGCQPIAGSDPLDIYRTDWWLDRSIEENLVNLRIDGRLYARLTGRSVIGA